MKSHYLLITILLIFGCESANHKQNDTGEFNWKLVNKCALDSLKVLSNLTLISYDECESHSDKFIALFGNNAHYVVKLNNSFVGYFSHDYERFYESNNWFLIVSDDLNELVSEMDIERDKVKRGVLEELLGFYTKTQYGTFTKTNSDSKPNILGESYSYSFESASNIHYFSILDSPKEPIKITQFIKAKAREVEAID